MLRLSQTVRGLQKGGQAYSLSNSPHFHRHHHSPPRRSALADESGVLASSCAGDTTLAALLVGYGTTARGGDYYLIKNSWGSDWGEDGLIRIGRSLSYGPNGQCDILKQPAYYPVAAFVPKEMSFSSICEVNGGCFSGQR